jgi:hypothetical protein
MRLMGGVGLGSRPASTSLFGARSGWPDKKPKVEIPAFTNHSRSKVIDIHPSYITYALANFVNVRTGNFAVEPAADFLVTYSC